MKVLYIRQPWAWLIVTGQKPIENRTWRTGYRGPVLIGASLTDESKDPDVIQYLRALGVDVPPNLPLGGIVGRANICGCVDKEEDLQSLSDRAWFVGPHGILMSDPVQIPLVKWRGFLSLRNATPELLAAVEAATQVNI